MSRSVTTNTIANLISRCWTMLASLIVVPIYIKLLGTEPYSLLTYFTTIQTILNLLGAGLSKTIRKEFASGLDDYQTYDDKYKILKSIEILYIIIGSLIVIICFSASGFIANNWMNVEHMDRTVVSKAIFCMGFMAAFQLIANIYYGCFLGLEKQIEGNVYMTAWATIKYLGGVICISLISKDVLILLYWYIFLDFTYALVTRIRLLYFIKKKAKVTWTFKDISCIKRVISYTINIMLISIGYVLCTQTDKICISKYVSLSAGGAYNSAYQLASLTIFIPTAIGNALFSRFSNNDYHGNSEESLILLKRSNALSTAFCAAIGAYIGFFCYELLIIWTKSQVYAECMKYAGVLLIIGVACTSIQEIEYEYMLSKGYTKINRIQTLLYILYSLIITPLTIKYFGVIGGATSILVMFGLSTIVYSAAFCKKFLNENCVLFTVRELILPVAISITSAYFVRNYLCADFTNIYQNVGIAIVFGMITVGLILLLSKYMNRNMKEENRVTTL